MPISETIRQAISQALAQTGVEISAVPLEHPADLKNGDYSSGIALQYAKQTAMPPRALAEEIVSKLGIIPGVSKIEIAGPGFINFYLSPSSFADAIAKAHREGWGKGRSYDGKRVMVEYTDPNPFKEFHIGHLMSNAIGESTSRLIEFSGATIKRANYQGDVGPHVAKAIHGMQVMERSFPKEDESLNEKVHFLGAAYIVGAKGYDSDVEIKNRIDALNRIIYERSNEKVNRLYDWGRKISLDHFEELYKLLGTKFDFYFFESATAPRGMALVKSHPDVFEESDGAVVYKGEQDGLHTRVFLTSKGLPTYEAKDLGLAQLKNETWTFDVSITVTAHEQAAYFAVVLAVMQKVLPEIAPKIQHISHGMMRLPSGKMSSRTGDVITGESLLMELRDEAKARAAESRAADPEKLAEEIAVAAIKYQILKQTSGKDIVFDRERALSLDGDSGPYLQYAHARAHQIMERAKGDGVAALIDPAIEPNEVARLLHRFPEIVEYAAKMLEPHILANYLVAFAAAFNSWYAQEQILDGTQAAQHKIALVDAVRSTLNTGLTLLGIPAPEKM